MMNVADFLNRTLFSFLFIRKTYLLSTRPIGTEFDRILADLMMDMQSSYSVTLEKHPSRLTLLFRGWGLPTATRRISIECVTERSILVSNNPSAGVLAFGFLIIAFLGCYEILVISDAAKCLLMKSCVPNYYDLILIIAPVLIYLGMMIVYGLQYLPSVRLYRSLIKSLVARLNLQESSPIASNIDV